MGQAAQRIEEEETSESNYLSFNIGEVSYAIEVGVVTEIIGLQNITPVPSVPRFVKGVINLRGKVIPVIDVRIRFGLEEQAYHERTCIIVVDVDGFVVGLVVDAVSEVFDLPAANIEPTPTLAQTVEGRCISGLGKVGETVKLILDPRQLLSSSDEEALIASEP